VESKYKKYTRQTLNFRAILVMGKCDKDTAFGILDYFYEQGGNFIDTYVSFKQPLRQCFPNMF
jgi:aryl-alcohol dehydrogenase-like predicted oxidoreductase